MHTALVVPPNGRVRWFSVVGVSHTLRFPRTGRAVSAGGSFPQIYIQVGDQGLFRPAQPLVAL